MSSLPFCLLPAAKFRPILSLENPLQLHPESYTVIDNVGIRLI